MAIYHFHTHPVSRSNGHSAVAGAAYRAGEKMIDNRTGEIHDYTHKQGVISSQIFTPQGVPIPERNDLWNKAEAAEKRKDARVAREWRIALPSELSVQDNQELMAIFSQQLADRYGVAVDASFHEPDKHGDDRNYHAHIYATTRKINEKGELTEKASIELCNSDRIRQCLPRSEQEVTYIRSEWANVCNRFLESKGIAERIDHRSFKERGITEIKPTQHVGRAGYEMGETSDLFNKNEQVKKFNAQSYRENPELVIDNVLKTKAVFDRRDLGIEISKYIDDPKEFKRVLMEVEKSEKLVMLEEFNSQELAKYSTLEMMQLERSLIEKAQEMHNDTGLSVSHHHIEQAIAKYPTITPEQVQAVRYVTGSNQLALVVGDAGTGKSFSMRVAREAWEKKGQRVIGTALAGKAAEELQQSSGIQSQTLRSLELQIEQGKFKLSHDDVIVVDEAGMIGTKQLNRLLENAQNAQAKVVLLGDDKQLAAIEAGAGFRTIKERIGATEITDIKRQKEEWAKEASKEFARGDQKEALKTYQEKGHIKHLETEAEAKQSIAKDYVHDNRNKGGSSVILAHRNADVKDINEAVRNERYAKGELNKDQAVQVSTEKGSREFAPNDRILFTKNDKNIGVMNGTLGTVKSIENNQFNVLLDSGSSVTFSPTDYEHVAHGYATTLHKAQGVTVDRSYVYASGSMDKNLSYVAMTRHKEESTVYANKEEFKDFKAMQDGMAKDRTKASTLDYTDKQHAENKTPEQPAKSSSQPLTPEQERQKMIDEFKAQREAAGYSNTPSQPLTPEQERQKMVDEFKAQREAAGYSNTPSQPLTPEQERQKMVDDFKAQQAQREASEQAKPQNQTEHVGQHDPFAQKDPFPQHDPFAQQRDPFAQKDRWGAGRDIHVKNEEVQQPQQQQEQQPEKQQGGMER